MIPSISSPPAWPSITDPTNFDQEAEDFVQWWEDDFGPELEAVIDAMNALGASMDAYAAGGAFSFPYTVSNATADADPGPGYLRFDNFAAQTSAATLRLDLLSSDAVDRTNELTYATASTSATKGRLKIVKRTDLTKWITADYTAMATPAGYRNITLANVVGSSAAPFALDDSVVIFFQPTGSKGTDGITTMAFDERSANAQLTDADSGLHMKASGTWTQTFAAVATLSANWYVVIENTTGDITLDPNGAETIDGLTSFVMYPGECRKISRNEAGTALVSVVLHPFHKIFTTNGTFTEPPGYIQFGGRAIGGGASGAKGATNASGGGGGACVEFSLLAANAGATEAVTVAAAAAGPTAANTDGTNGNNTSLGSIVTAYGGVKGLFASSGSAREGGGGGGTFSTGTTVTGGAPLGGASATDSTYGGGGGGSNVAAGGRSVWGGGGGGSTANSGTAFAGGMSVNGGGGGGAASNGVVSAGGASLFAGAGGAGVSAASGTDGTAPGGGGGGTQTGTKAGDGARGELRIWGIA
jgi:hypothetical protein